MFDLIEQNDKITIQDLATTLDVSKRTVFRDIDKLKKSNKIKRVGSEKKGHWEIINSFNSMVR